MPRFTPDAARKLRKVAAYLEHEIKRSQNTQSQDNQDSANPVQLSGDSKGILSAVEKYIRVDDGDAVDSGENTGAAGVGNDHAGSHTRSNPRRSTIKLTSGAIELNVRDFESITSQRRKSSVRVSVIIP